MILLKRKFLNLAIRKIASYVNTNTHLMLFFLSLCDVHQMKFAPHSSVLWYLYSDTTIYGSGMLMVGKYTTISIANVYSLSFYLFKSNTEL